jgi:protein-disulfide isomerase
MQKLRIGKFLVLLWVVTFFSASGHCQTPPTATRQAVAMVAGHTIYEDELAPLMEDQLQQLRNQEYDLKSRALEKLIDQKVLEAAASRNGLTADQLIAKEVSTSVQDPTDAEIQAYYLGQRERRPFEEVKVQLREALKKARAEQAKEAYIDRLRHESDVAVLLAPPKVEVGYDSSRVRGNADAPVTIVEFSDFECPYCRASESLIKNLLFKYGDNIKVAYRDFPLRQNHSHAEAAAEASHCASEQGKFWAYHDLLFSNPPKLDAAGLLEQARTAGLNESQFLSCLNTEKYKSAVETDVKAASRARVTGTPAFFINGIFIGGAQPSSVFEKTIDAELARLRVRNSPNSPKSVQGE